MVSYLAVITWFWFHFWGSSNEVKWVFFLGREMMSDVFLARVSDSVRDDGTGLENARQNGCYVKGCDRCDYNQSRFFVDS